MIDYKETVEHYRESGTPDEQLLVGFIDILEAELDRLQTANAWLADLLAHSIVAGEVDDQEGYMESSLEFADNFRKKLDRLQRLADLVPGLLDLRGIDRDAVTVDNGDRYICIACGTELEDNWDHCPNPDCPRFQAWELTQADNHYWQEQRSGYDKMKKLADMVVKDGEPGVLVVALEKMIGYAHAQSEKEATYGNFDEPIFDDITQAEQTLAECRRVIEVRAMTKNDEMIGSYKCHRCGATIRSGYQCELCEAVTQESEEPQPTGDVSEFCETCGGTGSLDISSPGIDEWDDCPDCDGTGKVLFKPQPTGDIAGLIDRMDDITTMFHDQCEGESYDDLADEHDVLLTKLRAAVVVQPVASGELAGESDDTVTIDGATYHIASDKLRTAVAALQARADEGRRTDDELCELFLMWRGIETPCENCGGAGQRTYPDTSTWRHCIGGQAITGDVCDACWGSGEKDKNKSGANLRKMDSAMRVLEARAEAGERDRDEWVRKYAELSDLVTSITDDNAHLRQERDFAVNGARATQKELFSLKRRYEILKAELAAIKDGDTDGNPIRS